MDTGAVVVMRYVTADLQTKNRFASRMRRCTPKTIHRDVTAQQNDAVRHDQFARK
jgi:hypothetical protein